MAAFPRFPLVIRHLPAVGGAALGVIVAAIIALLSADTLEHLVWTSGIAALVPAAQPPLGTTARGLLALGGGVAAGAIAWSVLFLLFGPGGFLAPGGETQKQPSVRRADAHPDAPPRRPMTAADLGTPLMEVGAPPVEQPLPCDLDQPLAAFDPAALPPTPRAPVRAVAALAPGERLETFQLTPPPPTAAAPRPAKREPASAQTIETLLRRLEEGAGRRSAQA